MSIVCEDYNNNFTVITVRIHSKQTNENEEFTTILDSNWHMQKHNPNQNKLKCKTKGKKIRGTKKPKNIRNLIN